MNDLNSQDFGVITELIREHAQARGSQAALVDDRRSLDYAGLDRLMDRVAAALQRDGLQPGDSIAICAASSVDYAAVFLGALRAGIVVAPLAPGSTPDSLARMVSDAQARLLFVDATVDEVTAAVDAQVSPRIALDGVAAGRTLADWLAPAASTFTPPAVQPAWPFNTIYSSGTTGEPKGIVQPHSMRWAHVRRGATYNYGPHAVTLLSTPLYSNTTLVVFFPTIAFGGTVVLMARFDAARYLALAQQHRVTHTMLVPVQYQRLMAVPEFDRYDLASFQFKFSTSAPFGAALKADVLRRWPGGLIEFYGMTPAPLL